MKCDVDALGLAPCTETKPAALEHLEHRGVIGQDLCNQLFEPRVAGNDGEMVQQFCANPLPLVLVNDNESNFGLPRLHDDVAAAADDQRLPAFLITATRATWLTKSTFEKKTISCSVKPRFTAKKRR